MTEVETEVVENSQEEANAPAQTTQTEEGGQTEPSETPTVPAAEYPHREGLIGRMEDTIKEVFDGELHVSLCHGTNGNVLVQPRDRDAATVADEDLGGYLLGLLK